jgi:hypothetical protein
MIEVPVPSRYLEVAVGWVVTVLAVSGVVNGEWWWWW